MCACCRPSVLDLYYSAHAGATAGVTQEFCLFFKNKLYSSIIFFLCSKPATGLVLPLGDVGLSVCGYCTLI